MRYLIYSRTSTKLQDTETQNNLCYKLIDNMGGGNATLYSDPNHSTSLPMEERTGLQEMLKNLKKGDLVVVYDIDRLGRDILEIITIYRKIKSSGARITSVTDSNCDNEFIFNIKGAFAQEEKARIKKRIKDKLAEKQSRMEKVGHTWYGFKTKDDELQLYNDKIPSHGKPYKLIPHEQEYQGLILMVQLHAEGLSYQQIADRLSSLGYTNRAGKPFQKMTVFRILQRKEKYNLFRVGR